MTSRKSFNLWRALTLFFYRRWAAGEPADRMPVGVPGNRDPEAPCTAYAPRPYKAGDFQDCETDGHYLCKGCVHRSPAHDRPLCPLTDKPHLWAGGGEAGGMYPIICTTCGTDLEDLTEEEYDAEYAAAHSDLSLYKKMMTGG